MTAPGDSTPPPTAPARAPQDRWWLSHVRGGRGWARWRRCLLGLVGVLLLLTPLFPMVVYLVPVVILVFAGVVFILCSLVQGLAPLLFFVTLLAWSVWIFLLYFGWSFGGGSQDRLFETVLWMAVPLPVAGTLLVDCVLLWRQ